MEMLVLLPAGVATREVWDWLDVLHERLGLEVVWSAKQAGPVPGHDPPMSFHADVAFEDLDGPATVLLLPGGFGSLELAHDPGMLDALRRVAAAPTVCLASSTGPLPLAAAGLLEGLPVSGHWLAAPWLRQFGAIPVSDRLVRAGRFFTAAGSVSVQTAARAAADYLAYGPMSDPIGSVDLGERA